MELLYFYLIATILGGLMGYLWNDDVYQKEKNELLLDLLDKMKDAREFESQKEWLLSELKKTKEWGAMIGSENVNLRGYEPAENQTSKVTQGEAA